jgi:hypothetical protein
MAVSRYEARWSKEHPGEAVIAIEKDGVRFTARVKPNDCVPRSMAEALVDATSAAIAFWLKSGKLKLAGKRRGRGLYLVRDLYPIAQERDVTPK